MNEKGPGRRSYENSCKLLQELGYLEPGEFPQIPDKRPQNEDEDALGVGYFRTFVGEGDLENLTLARAFFARSEVGPVSFKNTDLSESTLCWNDFNEVDFTNADLSRCDLRANQFAATIFVRADLRHSDLRHSTFEDCVFEQADMQGATLAQHQAVAMNLSQEQRQAIDWRIDDGEEPSGG